MPLQFRESYSTISNFNWEQNTYRHTKGPARLGRGLSDPTLSRPRKEAKKEGRKDVWKEGRREGRRKERMKKGKH
jgi:hypothetical protein